MRAGQYRQKDIFICKHIKDNLAIVTIETAEGNSNFYSPMMTLG